MEETLWYPPGSVGHNNYRRGARSSWGTFATCRSQRHVANVPHVKRAACEEETDDDLTLRDASMYAC